MNGLRGLGTRIFQKSLMKDPIEIPKNSKYQIFNQSFSLRFPEIIGKTKKTFLNHPAGFAASKTTISLPQILGSKILENMRQKSPSIGGDQIYNRRMTDFQIEFRRRLVDLSERLKKPTGRECKVLALRLPSADSILLAGPSQKVFEVPRSISKQIVHYSQLERALVGVRRLRKLEENLKIESQLQCFLSKEIQIVDGSQRAVVLVKNLSVQPQTPIIKLYSTPSLYVTSEMTQFFNRLRKNIAREQNTTDKFRRKTESLEYSNSVFQA